MTTIQTLWLLGLVCVAGSSCSREKDKERRANGNDSLILKIRFTPAFEEHSEILLSKADSVKFIQILIKNNSSVDPTEDTFWYKRIYLSNQQYLKLDSTLVKECSQKPIYRKKDRVVDGMGISSFLISNADTTSINYHSPHREEDSAGYAFSKSLIDILRNTFPDTLITEYFNDIDVYLDDSKWHRADPKGRIDQLRMKKYHWTIRKPD